MVEHKGTISSAELISPMIRMISNANFICGETIIPFGVMGASPCSD
jgi:hypothetical protein